MFHFWKISPSHAQVVLCCVLLEKEIPEAWKSFGFLLGSYFANYDMLIITWIKLRAIKPLCFLRRNLCSFFGRLRLLMQLKSNLWLLFRSYLSICTCVGVTLIFDKPSVWVRRIKHADCHVLICLPMWIISIMYFEIMVFTILSNEL